MKKGKLKKILATSAMGIMALAMPFALTGCDKDSDINVRVDGDYIQWQVEGDSDWTNLLTIEEVKNLLGESYKGDAGVDGREVEFRKTETHIQWRYVSNDSWKNLISLDELRDSGVSGSDFTPYLTVTGISTEYLVDEGLDLSNAVLVYHKAENDNYIKIVSEDMIAWPGTAVAGDFVMTIVYEGKSVEVEYSVYDAESIIAKIINDSKDITEVKKTEIVESGEKFEILKNNVLYSFDSSNPDGSISQQWFGVDGENGYEYHYVYDSPYENISNKYIYDISEVNTKVEDYLSELMYDEDFNYNISLIKNPNGTFKLEFVSITETSSSKTTRKEEFIIQNNVIVSQIVTDICDFTVDPDSAMGNLIETFVREFEFSYIVIEDIPEIPQGVDWDIIDVRE